MAKMEQYRTCSHVQENSARLSYNEFVKQILKKIIKKITGFTEIPIQYFENIVGDTTVNMQ